MKITWFSLWSLKLALADKTAVWNGLGDIHLSGSAHKNVTSKDTASYLQECLKCLKIKKTDNAYLSVRKEWRRMLSVLFEITASDCSKQQSSSSKCVPVVRTLSVSLCHWWQRWVSWTVISVPWKHPAWLVLCLELLQILNVVKKGNGSWNSLFVVLATGKIQWQRVLVSNCCSSLFGDLKVGAQNKLVP